MTGLKGKLAHKRSGTTRSSASDAAQRCHLIAVLQRMIVQLEGGALVAAEPAGGGVHALHGRALQEA